MNTKHTPKLIYLDELRSIIQKFDKQEISMSKFCEIINDKAEKIISANTELLKALERITNQSEETGRDGCTYGDTEFDSLSACYGANQQLLYDKKIAFEAINLSTAILKPSCLERESEGIFNEGDQG